METIIKGVNITDPAGPHDGTTKDVHVRGGIIVDIQDVINPSKSVTEWNEPGAHLSIGWLDLQADFADPGFEQKEGLENGLRAARSGGFTHVVLNVNQHPVPDTKSNLAYLIARSADCDAHLFPMGTVSQGRNGRQLAEMRDLSEAGAVAFSDDAPINSVEMLRRALEYSHDLPQPIVSCPLELGLNANPQMHEGMVSTQMGVVGNPTTSETMRVKRDLEILRYAGGKLHFSCISSMESVQLIREAKSEGLSVTCATSAHHLFFLDEDLSSFDGTLKTLPPFRTSADREALCNGLLDETIDALVSDHRPQDLEHHDVEFILASNGMAGIESVFPVAMAGLAHKSDAHNAIIRALTIGPRSVLGLDTPHIEVGAVANLTWYHPTQTGDVPATSAAENRPNYHERSIAFSGKGVVLGTVLG
ncbi:MAG TPA: dihydroorotase [Flavobacteriales bacterium]|nr:dihydroorotase [Flavobacteriales bacterium]